MQQIMMKKNFFNLRENNKKFYLIIAFLISLCVTTVKSQVKILPLGNSITYDNHSDDTRSVGERISYRYELYQLLEADGLDFDLIGNRYAGYNYIPNDYAYCAGFPGITTAQMVYLINTGYNQVQSIYEAPGAYLNYYPADIILLHIGTNEVTESSADVETLLTRIRVYLPNAVILVAKIINRKTNDAVTTTFNNNVASYVNSLGDPKIIMVDMENGAYINYATDMYDNLHPNQLGYDKMGQKWYDAIMDINSSPVISSIPKQITQEGSNFTNLDLKNYVTDVDQASSTLTNWTFTYSSEPKINVSLSNGVASVSVLDPEWSGKDTVLYKITDNGNGAFEKSDSIYVIYEVSAENDPPVSNGILISSITEDETYTFTTSDFDVDDIDSDIEDLFVILNSGENYTVISNNKLKPDENFEGNLTFNIQFCDLIDTSEVYSYTINVEAVNDAPVINAQVTYPEVKEKAPLVINKSDLDFEDVDDDDTSLSLIILPGEKYTIENNIVYMNNGTVGYQYVDVQLTDSKDTSDIFDFRVTVLSAAKPPVFVTSPDTLAGENILYEYYFNAVDSNDDEITYDLTRSPDFLDIDLENKKVYGTPNRDDIGEDYVVEISATDGMYTVFQLFRLDVINLNDEPYFTSTPITAADDYELYTYEFSASDDDESDMLVFFPEDLPDWLTFDESLNQLRGIPDWSDAGEVYNTVIGVTDKSDTVYQSFKIIVSNKNSLPVFESTPDTSVYADSLYIYNLEFSDVDEDDDAQVTVYEKPDWLSYDTGQFSFYGTPTKDDAGKYKLTIGIWDGRAETSEIFYITVYPNTKSDYDSFIAEELMSIYPNPATTYLKVDFDETTINQLMVKIYNINGTLLKQIEINSSTILELEDLQPGFYNVILDSGEYRLVKKLVVR